MMANASASINEGKSPAIKLAEALLSALKAQIKLFFNRLEEF